MSEKRQREERKEDRVEDADRVIPLLQVNGRPTGWTTVRNIKKMLKGGDHVSC